jgi:hypothetical protein
MDLRKLKKLIDLVEESGIAELEITEGEEKVRISKSSNPAQGSATPVASACFCHPGWGWLVASFSCRSHSRRPRCKITHGGNVLP